MKQKRVTQQEAAELYAQLLLMGLQSWSTLNRLLIDRWSMSGMLHVKSLAWKIVEARTHGCLKEKEQ